MYIPQIREQMSGPNNFQYEKSILGCGPLVWAGLWNKRVWADYEQLLRPVFPLFRGQKNILNFFWKHHSVRTEKLQRKKVKKNIFFLGRFFFSEKPFFFWAKIWVEFECKYREVGTRLLLAILWDYSGFQCHFSYFIASFLLKTGH